MPFSVSVYCERYFYMLFKPRPLSLTAIKVIHSDMDMMFFSFYFAFFNFSVFSTHSVGTLGGVSLAL